MMRRAPKRGFTLVEALITTGILVAVLGVLGAIGGDIFRFRSGLTAALSTQSDARRVLRPFADELRAAAYSATGAYPIAETASSSITFYVNVDADAAIERARYVVLAGELRKVVSQPAGNPAVYGSPATTTLVRGVLASTTYFSYYGEGYDGTASSTALGFPVSPSEVRSAKIWISVDEDPYRAPGPAELTTAATVRNLRGTSHEDE